MEKRKFILLIVIVILAVAVWNSYEIEQFFKKFLTASERLISGNEFVAGFIFLTLGAFSAMFAFFSSVVLVPVATYNFGTLTTFILLLGGWALGGALTYFIGKRWGRPLVGYFFRPERLKYYENLIAPRLNFFMVFLFRLAMPAEVPGYLLGILRYGFKPYLAATALAELPFALGAVYGSELFLNKEKSFFFTVVVLIAAVFAVAFYVFRRKTNNIK